MRLLSNSPSARLRRHASIATGLVLDLGNFDGLIGIGRVCRKSLLIVASGDTLAGPRLCKQTGNAYSGLIAIDVDLSGLCLTRLFSP